MKDTISFDLAILGGGPAGMTAAIYAAQANINTILLEESTTGGLVNSTNLVLNFPSKKAVNGMSLMAEVREQVDALNVPVEEICEIEHLDLTGGVKIIETDEAVYEVRAVILATGRKPIELDPPMDCDQIHYCSICDGGVYEGKRVVVVGGGNSAFDESIYLLNIGIRHITMLEIMDDFIAAKTSQDNLFSTGKAVGKTGVKLAGIHQEDGRLKFVVVEHCKTGEKEQIDADGIFVFIGQKPSSRLFANHVNLDPQGYILADADMKTSVKGVFSAGDINQKTFRQITTAMSDGTIAALSAERYLRI
ncbi:MAG: FAD-dependent oxidoreductase [Deltaproteobacteria bacterium]|nr:FAD-dependent oxidoreductase [Deltaproteobacteria bacterium]MBW2634953.1 FAD-dependent oxidoreductase [Deltaproteobacteria bacterium]